MKLSVCDVYMLVSLDEHLVIELSHALGTSQNLSTTLQKEYCKSSPLYSHQSPLVYSVTKFLFRTSHKPYVLPLLQTILFAGISFLLEAKLHFFFWGGGGG